MHLGLLMRNTSKQPLFFRPVSEGAQKAAASEGKAAPSEARCGFVRSITAYGYDFFHILE